MAFEKLGRQLLDDAQKEAQAIVARAEAEADKITGHAKEKQKQTIALARQGAKEFAQREKSEKISSANLEAKKIVDEEKNAVVEKALKAVFDEVEAFAWTKQYPAFLKKLVLEGERELGRNCTVSVNKKDQNAAKKLFSNVSKQPAGICGGAIISTKDGLVRVDNSFESLFEQEKENIKKEIFLQLFERGKK